MRIGMVPVLGGDGGGVYQYSLTMLQALSEIKAQGSNDEFVVFASSTYHPVLTSLQRDGWEVRALVPSFGQQVVDGARRIAGEGPHREAWRRLRSRLSHLKIGSTSSRPAEDPNPDQVTSRPELGRHLKSCAVDLMIYPFPNPMAFEAGVPYIVAVHDVQSRLQPEWPEFALSEPTQREYVLRNAIRYATTVLAESEVGREDILQVYAAYGATSARIRVLPFLPASYLSRAVSGKAVSDLKRHYRLPERYFFYPAQFWPHKNHLRIVEALALLRRERGLRISVVLCGSHSGALREGTFTEAMAVAERLGVREQIRYIGFVPDEHMAGLYAAASGLIMPTFFGPTNIPVLEAWSLNCPVLTSDIRGIRGQTGSAALLVNPTSTEAIAQGMHALWTDDVLRADLIDQGHRRLRAYLPDEHRRLLAEILEEAKVRIGVDAGCRGAR